MARKTKATNPSASTPTEGLGDEIGDDMQADPASSYASSESDDGDSDGAAESMQGAGGETQGTGGILDSAKEAASQAKRAAGHVVEEVKDRATSRVDEQRHTVASGLEAVAQAFRSMGDNLRNQQQGPVAHYVADMGHAMGGQMERLAQHLHGRDIRQLVSDVENFARRSPATFLGGAFVLGLAASRFLKSSQPVPDSIANMPDPNRALPAASTPAAGTRNPIGGV